MKHPLSLFCFLLSATAAVGQSPSAAVSANTNQYSTAGGQVTFTVTLNYPADTAAVGFSAKPPTATWAYASTAGTNVPEVKPNANDTTDPSIPGSVFGWAYQDVPPGAASFTFTLSYPAGLTGDQVIHFKADYRRDNVLTDIPVTAITIVETPEAPAITTQPANASAGAGQNASFTVAATGKPAPTIAWQRSTDGGVNWTSLTNGSGISGADTVTLTVASVTLAMNNHRFRAVASNGVGTNAISNSATLTVTQAAAISVQPRSQAVATGGTLTLTVLATGNPAPSYQWKKGGVDLTNGGRISGATSATLTITAVESGDVGSYTVVVGNGIGTPVTSTAAAVTLTPAGFAATHAVVGGGYLPGGNITITNTITYGSELSSLSWSVLLPAGWSFVSAVNAGTPAAQPNAGDISVLDWIWSSFPTSPATFTYTVKAPNNASGNYAFAALVEFGIGDAKHQVVAQNDPLVVGQLLYHGADTNQNWKIDVSELTRIIALYNTRYTTPDGKVRTGAYKDAPAGTTTVDGFATDTLREPTGSFTLSRFHTADYNQNGKIDVAELTRVIALYNTRFTTPDGKIRTGYYKPAATGSTTVDGYTADATRDPNAP